MKRLIRRWLGIEETARVDALALNRNELAWFNLAAGPIDGWFSFGEHGNPPFDTPVQVVCLRQGPTGGVMHVAIGIRRRRFMNTEAGPKEAWQVFTNPDFADPSGASGTIIYWRPLSPLPRSVALRPDPEPAPGQNG
jgi:hypothetical protein